MQEPGSSISAGSGPPGGTAVSPDVETLIAAHQSEIERRLETGLREIRASATTLMREIASEVWRTAGGDKDEIRDTIVEELSRDQAIRALIAHADERFQALSVRTAQLEDTVTDIGDSVARVNAQLAEGVSLLAKLGSAGTVDPSVLGRLAERDQAIIEAVRTRIQEHGDLITQETARISGAMEAYVQHGVQAIGQLAGTMETQIEAIASRDREIEARVATLFADQMRQLAEQLQLMYERMAIDTTSLSESIGHIATRAEERTRALGEYLHLVNDRIAVSARETASHTGRMVDARVMGLARMVRSDSEALRAELVRVASQQEVTLTRSLDDRLEARVEDQARAIEARAAEQVRLIDARMLEATAEMERRFAAVTESVDGKITSLARLIRSDNETIAQQIVADQDASKQALRAMKELQANLPSEVIENVEQRFASLAESIERSNEMLAKRIDRMAETIGAQHETDIQVVVDRMGDAMHALASLGRAQGGRGNGPAEPRIELD